MKLMISLLTAIILTVGASGVQAASTTEQICTTDSYGNRSCSDSSTSTTQEVSYSSASTNTNVEILNTSTPGWVQTAAVAIVSLGAVSVVLRKKIA